MRIPREDTPADRLACQILNDQWKIRGHRQSKDYLLMDYADVVDSLKDLLQVELLKFAVDAVSAGRTADQLRMELDEAKTRIR